MLNWVCATFTSQSKPGTARAVWLIATGALCVVMSLTPCMGQGPRATSFSPMEASRETTASLSVRVKDQHDGLIADARVFLTSDSSLRRVAEAQTNPAGESYFPKLQPGSYAIQVEFPGFSSSRQNVLLAAGASSTVDMSGTFHDGVMGEVVVPAKHPVLRRFKRLVPKIHF